MYPLLDNGDRVVADRLVYKVSEIQRYDVVVFYSPSDPQSYFIKRVIGLPGETLRIQNGNVFIDGAKLDDAFITDEFRSFENLNSVLIPLGHYFVVGDNRNNSNDSRSWSLHRYSWPFVGERYVLGKIRCRIWPLQRIGWFSSERLITSK